MTVAAAPAPLPLQDLPSCLVPANPRSTRLIFGAAYSADAIDILRALPTASINLVITSPPYAFTSRKNTETQTRAIMSNGCCPFAREIRAGSQGRR